MYSNIGYGEIGSFDYYVNSFGNRLELLSRLYPELLILLVILCICIFILFVKISIIKNEIKKLKKVKKTENSISDLNKNNDNKGINKEQKKTTNYNTLLITIITVSFAIIFVFVVIFCTSLLFNKDFIISKFKTSNFDVNDGSMNIINLKADRNYLGYFFNLSQNDGNIVYNHNGIYWGFEQDFKKRSWFYAAEYTKHDVKASSTLKSQGKFSYNPSNIKDKSRHNAWIEGVDGYGIGEYIEFTSSFKHVSGKNIDLVGLCIVNGYADNINKWKNNSRVKKLKMYFNDKYIANILLIDMMEPQYIDIKPLNITVKSEEEYSLKFEIADVYKGDKYADTAITGISVEYYAPDVGGA